MKIALGSDHAGFSYKEQIKSFLTSAGHEVCDFGTCSDAPVDYPGFIRPAAEAVARGECERGIVFGGSGNGEAIVANKVRGVRCALCWSLDTARWAREHNDANVLAIGERTIPSALALEIVRVWLTTDFSGGRHAARVRAILQSRANALGLEDVSGNVAIGFSIAADGAFSGRIDRSSGNFEIDGAIRRMLASVSMPPPPGGRYSASVTIRVR